MLKLTPKNLKGKKKDVDFDEILNDVGHFGTYQVYVCLAVMITSLFYSIYGGEHHWTGADVEHRCVVPECESLPYKFNPGSWESYALPNGTKRYCERLTPTGGGCNQEGFSNQTQKCSTWVYENNNTIIPEFNLACQGDKELLLGYYYYAGIVISLGPSAIISDAYGRKLTYFLMIMFASVTGILRSFSINFVMFLAFEFLGAILTGGMYNVGFVLALEMVGVSHRVSVATLIASAYPVGNVVLSVLAYYYPYWRILTRCIYVPTTLLFVYYFITDESVRWLLSKGKKKEAARILAKVATRNKRSISPASIKMLAEEFEEFAKHGEPTTSTAPTGKHVEIKNPDAPFLLIRLVKSKILVTRFTICALWWIAHMCIYHGTSMRYVMLARGNRYVKFAVVGLLEILGYSMSVFTLDKIGRKRPIILGFFICGFLLMAVPYLPAKSDSFLYMLCMVTIGMVANSNYIYTFELFPTEVRMSLFNFCVILGRLGAVLTLFIQSLEVYWKPLPFLIHGFTSIFAGYLVMLAPETINTRLPDSIADIEDFQYYDN